MLGKDKQIQSDDLFQVTQDLRGTGGAPSLSSIEVNLSDGGCNIISSILLSLNAVCQQTHHTLWVDYNSDCLSSLWVHFFIEKWWYYSMEGLFYTTLPHAEAQITHQEDADRQCWP